MLATIGKRRAAKDGLCGRESDLFDAHRLAAPLARTERGASGCDASTCAKAAHVLSWENARSQEIERAPRTITLDSAPEGAAVRSILLALRASKVAAVQHLADLCDRRGLGGLRVLRATVQPISGLLVDVDQIQPRTSGGASSGRGRHDEVLGDASLQS